MLNNGQKQKSMRAVETLDQIMPETHWKKVDYIKVDVEGYEYEVMKGAREIIKQSKPVVLLEMVPEFLKRYGSTPEELQKYLVRLGYRVYTTRLDSMASHWQEIPRMRDRLFVHPDNPAYKQVLSHRRVTIFD